MEELDGSVLFRLSIGCLIVVEDEVHGEMPGDEILVDVWPS